MDMTQLIVVLFLFTILAVMGFAAFSKRKTEERMSDPNAPKSSLATDGPDHKKAD
jgi:Tfp pilus assembly protein PilX